MDLSIKKDNNNSILTRPTHNGAESVGGACPAPSDGAETSATPPLVTLPPELEPLNPKLKESEPFEAACCDLERYFQKNAAIRKGDKDDEGSGRRSRRRRDLAMPVKEENGVDSSDSRDVSRASSVERGENSNPGIRRVPSIRAANTNRKLTAAIKRLHEDESMDMIPPAPAGTPISGVSTQPTSDTEGDDSQSRPQRAAVANATAISEALAGKKKKGRPRKVPVDLAELAVKNERIASSISGLDLLHDTTLRCIEG